MAGGQNNRRHNAYFARRLASMPGAEETEPSPLPTRYPRHCWIVGVPDLPDHTAALLVGWRASGEGWLGRVVIAQQADDGTGLVVIERWLPEEYLEPAGVPDGPET